MKKIIFIFFILTSVALSADINDDLVEAASKNKLSKIKSLLKDGANVNYQNDYGYTALMWASYNNNIEIAKFLLDNNSNVNLKSNEGFTSLIFASQLGNVEIAKLLIDKDADINIKTNNNKTAIMYASSNGYIDIVKLLLLKNVDVNIKDKDGNTALKLASLNKHNDIVEIINASGKVIDIDKINWDKTNKESVEEHIEFLKSVTDESFKSTAEQSLNNLLERKLIKYIDSKFKPYNKYKELPIKTDDGSELGQLIDILRLPLLAINPNTGEKPIKIKFRKNNNYKNGFDLILNTQAKDVIIVLKPYKEWLVAVSLESDNQINPSNWSLALAILVESMKGYPNIDSIDLDLFGKK